MDSDNYPETCHAIYIVNGGMAFGAIWRIVSPFVDKGTRDKVHVVGSGKYMQVGVSGVVEWVRQPQLPGRHAGGSKGPQPRRGPWESMPLPVLVSRASLLHL